LDSSKIRILRSFRSK